MGDTSKLLFEHNLEQLAEAKNPQIIMERYRILMARVCQTMQDLTKDDDFAELNQRIADIEAYDAQIRDYLYEEAATSVAHYDDRTGEVLVNDLPSDLQLLPQDDGFVVKNIPAWMLGHSAKKKYPPVYHKDRPFIRKRQLWHWMLRKIKQDYVGRVRAGELMALPENPSQYARVLFVLRSTEDYQVSDLDYYLPVIQVAINALVENELLLSDRPSNLSYAAEWQQEQLDTPVVDVKVQWFERDLPLWGGR
ncbi:hypothetical protein [Alicyclobacillus sp. ALC3]|uniref:hypothetical protein n=1 Tax=Alicyclobacillus sp. ALC3 TaxID=2796143 RepID=UPI00237A0429|nr:hypothetical protein [Alicyclobacillus sp. ALC3]WDL99791.1 hypothetical protein JC200_23760 [Alicyclobacillus sp. ALC3]